MPYFIGILKFLLLAFNFTFYSKICYYYYYHNLYIDIIMVGLRKEIYSSLINAISVWIPVIF